MSKTTNKQNFNFTEMFAVIKFYIDLLLSFSYYSNVEQNAGITPASAYDFENKHQVNDRLANVIINAYAEQQPDQNPYIPAAA